MTMCLSCLKPLERGSFCPFCGQDNKPEPRLTLEVQRAKFVLNQRCLAKFRIHAHTPVRLQVKLGIEHLSIQDNTVAVPADKSTRPSQLAFPFMPTSAGEFRVTELSVIASSDDGLWAFKLDEQDLSIRVSSTDAGSSGIVYNIHVQEIYGSDVNIGDRKPPVVEAEWQPIHLILDPGKTRQLRNPVKPPEPKQPIARPPETIDKTAKMIGDVLSNPYSEQVVKRQILALAAKNLHLSGVLAALVNGLRIVKDAETRRELLGLLSNLDTSRFDNLEAFYSALMALFSEEKERAMRTELLARLSTALHQDERLAPFFIDLVSLPNLSEDEHRVSLDALASLPALSEATVILMLESARRSAADVQQAAIGMAQRIPHWTEPLIEALQPYLNVKVDLDLRRRILKRLAETPSPRQADFERALAELAP